MLLLAVAACSQRDGRASWLWVAGYFLVLTLGELYILPNGLGLFARLAPPKLGATTVAAWYLAIFTGSLTAGFIGSWYSSLRPPFFFLVLTGVASLASAMLLMLDRRARAVEQARIADRSALPPPSPRDWPPMSESNRNNSSNLAACSVPPREGGSAAQVNRRGL